MFEYWRRLNADNSNKKEKRPYIGLFSYIGINKGKKHSKYVSFIFCLFLVAVELGLVRAVDLHADVVGLLLTQLGELCAQLGQV